MKKIGAAYCAAAAAANAIAAAARIGDAIVSAMSTARLNGSMVYFARFRTFLRKIDRRILLGRI